MKRYRIMIEGEDRSLWCEANNKTMEWCEDNGEKLCQKYENAQWFIESEEPLNYNPDPYLENYYE